MIYCAAYTDEGKRAHTQSFEWSQLKQATAWSVEHSERGYYVLQWSGSKPPILYPYDMKPKAKV